MAASMRTRSSTEWRYPGVSTSSISGELRGRTRGLDTLDPRLSYSAQLRSRRARPAAELLGVAVDGRARAHQVAVAVHAVDACAGRPVLVVRPRRCCPTPACPGRRPAGAGTGAANGRRPAGSGCAVRCATDCRRPATAPPPPRRPRPEWRSGVRRTWFSSVADSTRWVRSSTCPRPESSSLARETRSRSGVWPRRRQSPRWPW